jgi:hypothetical protein
MKTFPLGFYRDTSVFKRPAERRLGHTDRRCTLRGGRRALDLVRTGVVAALCALVSSSAIAQVPVRFGFDAKSVQRARGLGMPVTYAGTWAGAWNQKWGWDGVEEDLRAAKAAGAVPVVQWWYWGDDISPSCVENGCRDRYHGVQKDKATWSRLSNELADLIVRVGGAHSQALVVIETEFNKNGIENYEPFDGYLAEQAAIFHQRGLKVVVGFGNWGQSQWKNFDRAVAAADLLGTMALQSSVRDASTYLSGADQLITAAQYFQHTFAKRTFVDFAFSSYPEPSYARFQDAVIRDIFRRMDELRAAGVQGMVWRMLSDDPTFDTTNYHGIAERYFGLLHADGSPKLAFMPFLNGMLTEAEAVAAPPPIPSPAVLTNLSIWWPTDGSTLSGTQPFKARIEDVALTDYDMYWQVDGGMLNGMVDSYTDAAHKEASVSVTGWTWRGNGPYRVNFVARDRKGTTLAQSVTIYIAR